MDRSEARKILIENFSVPQISGNSEEDTQFNTKMQTAFNMALQALESIDKIRAEIAEEINKETYGHDIVTNQGIRTGYLSALCIINKHTESNG